jgi:hypothetical protein
MRCNEFGTLPYSNLDAEHAKKAYKKIFSPSTGKQNVGLLIK